MSKSGRTEKHRVVIVGGGLAGIETALYLRSVLEDRISVTLISERDTFVYRPFLTYVAFGLPADQVQFDLRKIAEQHDFHLEIGRVDRVDPDGRRVRFGSQSIAYDSLVLATGASTESEPLPGLRRSYTVWNTDEMMRLHDRLERSVEEASTKQPARVVFLVPPGASWTGPIYELAMMMSAWLTWKGVRDAFDVRLITSESRHVEALGEQVHVRLAESLAYQQIETETDRDARRVETGHVIFDDDGAVPFDILINAAVYMGAGPRENLATGDRGFYQTDHDSRRLVSTDHIYAVGDGSDYPVKQGFIALLQADAAAEHITSAILDREPMFTFSATLFWLMEEFDQVLFARAEEDVNEVEVDNLPTGRLRRLEAMGYLPRQQRLGNPLYSGLLWKGTEIGLTLVKQLESRA